GAGIGGAERRVAVCSRYLPDDAIEARMPAVLSLALVVPDETLATRRDWRVPDGPRARRLLPGMLLGSHVAPVRRRRDEPGRYSRTHRMDRCREIIAGGRARRTRERPAVDCHRRLDAG